MNTVHGKIAIKSHATKIWDALINPAKIVLYTGSHIETTG